MIAIKEPKSIVLGTFFAGFGPLVGGSVFYLIRGGVERPRFIETLIFSLIAFPFAVAFTCIFGLPLFFVARRFHVAKWWSAIACGLLVGLAAQFIVLSGTSAVENLLLYSLEGVASALLFFSVWRRGNHA